MVGIILIAILFILVVSAICSGDGSSANTSTERNVSSQRNRNIYYDCSYSECPSCGAPYYDGFCEECGYPDINQVRIVNGLDLVLLYNP